MNETNNEFNILHELPEELEEEEFRTILDTGCLRLERIVSLGHVTKEGHWYEQERDEWVMILDGSGEIEFSDGSRKKLFPGDHILIRAGQKHRVSWTDPDKKTIWLALHFEDGP